MNSIVEENKSIYFAKLCEKALHNCPISTFDDIFSIKWENYVECSTAELYIGNSPMGVHR